MLVMVTLTTALLSLDAAAVLVTPIIVALAGHVGLSPLRFALSTVWLANTASLSLPMSSLTNLLAADVFGDHPVDFVEVAWAPALTGMAMGIHRRSLTHRFALVKRSRLPDRPPSAAAGLGRGGGRRAVPPGRLRRPKPSALGSEQNETRSQACGGPSDSSPAPSCSSAPPMPTVSHRPWQRSRHRRRILEPSPACRRRCPGRQYNEQSATYLALFSIAESPLRMAALLIDVNLAPLVSP